LRIITQIGFVNHFILTQTQLMKNPPIKTIDEYLALLPDIQMEALASLHGQIVELVPNVEEAISYQIPTFKYLKKHLVGYGAFKNHCSFFVMSNTLLDNFKEQLKGFDYDGGTIRFTPQNPLPKDLIEAIVKARMTMVENTLKK
jgi:uncharacterized protein YdhG (YjbR/CyaY superfamily)